jgi:hypothetical protein
MTGRGMSRKSLELISVAREILVEIKPASAEAALIAVAGLMREGGTP